MKYMRSAMADLPVITDDTIYCLTESGSLWSVRLDGTGSAIVSQSATEQDIAAVQPQAKWTLEDGSLTIAATGSIIADVSAACALGNTLYYVSSENGGSPMLRTVPLDGSQPGLLQPGLVVMEPVSMIATPQAVVLISDIISDPDGDSRTLQVINLDTWTLTEQAGQPANLCAAAVINGKLYRYAQDLTGNWTLLPDDEDADADAGYITRDAATSAPTVTPTATPQPSSTATPTSKPTATPYATGSAADEDDGTIRYGASGT